MNLLFCIDKKFIPQLLDSLWSISQRGGAARYDAYVLHSDLLEEDMGRIRAGVPEAIACHFIDVPPELFAGFPVTKRYPQQIYYRLAAPLLLPSALDRALYLDVDTTIINPLVTLYGSGFEGNLFMACTHTKDILTKVNAMRLGIHPKQDVPYINTGVMMLNLPLLRKEFDLNLIRDYALDKQSVLILPDQDILSALYGDRVKLLDPMIYNLSDRTLKLYNANPSHQKRDVDWVRRNSVVIHYLGKNKPWTEGYVGVLDIFYHESIQARLEKQGDQDALQTSGSARQ